MKIFKLFINTVLAIESIIFSIALILMLYTGSPNSFLVAHFTGSITFITLIGTLFYIIKSRYFTYKSHFTSWSFILCTISISLMILGYFFFLFEKISPYSHAISSLNFDVATSGLSISVILLIKIISMLEKDLV